MGGRFHRYAALIVALGAAGCSESYSSGTVDAAPGGADASDPGKPDAGANPTQLPFTVDDWFAPSGYMGDGESPGAITDKPMCMPSRPSGWVGHCHRFAYTPGTKKWGGVYWQYPDGNWGDHPGLVIPTGATKVSFQAWGEAGGEKLKFLVGMKAVDGFEIDKEGVELTTTPTLVEIDLTGATYGKVVGGFGWVAADATSAISFNVDDLHWQ